MYNYNLICADTDSFTICKPDGSIFSKEETDRLTIELNSLYPERINWEFEFNYPKMIVLKSKNYIMIDQKGKRKIKGSALKSATLEPIFKQFLNEMLDIIIEIVNIEERDKKLVDIYNRYVIMIDDIEDIKPWAKKQTLSKTTFDSERANETKVIDAIKGKEYGVGDKVYLITSVRMIPTGEVYKVGKNKGQPKMKKEPYLTLLEDYKGDYDKSTYYSKLYATAQRFETILDTKIMFPKHKEKL